MAAKWCGATTLLLAALLVAGAPQASAGDEPPLADGRPWRLLLEQQLKSEKACDLLEVILFDEFERDGEKMLEGKISCADGRQFDFRRPREHLKFEIELCGAAVC